MPLPGKDERERQVCFSFLLSLCNMPAGSGIFHFLGFQPCMEMSVEQESQSLPTRQSSLKGPVPQPYSRWLLCLESSRGWAVSAARRFLCDHCGRSLLVCSTVPTWVSSGDAAPEQPDLGLTFSFSTQGCSCPQNKVLDCWQLCQPALPALQPCLQLCFSAACFSVQLIL